MAFAPPDTTLLEQEHCTAGTIVCLLVHKGSPLAPLSKLDLFVTGGFVSCDEFIFGMEKI